MKKRDQDFLLGVTVIAMLATFLGTFMFLYPGLGPPRRIIQVRFPHEDGMVPLKAGCRVLLSNAIDVGEVTDVAIREMFESGRSAAFIIVTAKVNESLPLYGNCRIASNQPAVGGNGYLNIQMIGTPDVPLASDLMIRGEPPESFAAAVSALSRRVLSEGGLADQLERLFDARSEGSPMYKLAASLDDINAITRSLRGQLSPDEEHALLGKLNRVLDNVQLMSAALRGEFSAENESGAVSKVHAALDSLAAGVEQATALIRDNRARLENTLANIEHATATLDQDVLPRVAGELDRNDRDSIVGRVHRLMAAIDESMSDVRIATQTGRDLLVTGSPAIARTLQNVQEMSDELRRASLELRLNPSKLIWGPESWQKDKLPIFEAARNFAEAAMSLDDAARRLTAVASIRDGDSSVSQQRIQEISRALDEAFERFRRAEQFLYEKMK